MNRPRTSLFSILSLLIVCWATVPSPAFAAELRGDLSNVKASDQAVLKAILDEAGITAADITSTMRTVAKQASLMCQAAARDFAGTYALYCQAGKNMLDKYDASKSCAEQQATLTAELEAQMPLARELGCLTHVENDQVYAVDLAANTIPEARHPALVTAGEKAVSDGKVIRFFYPPRDKKAFHFEFEK